ncbi:MAG: hypothetical protein B6D58_02325 [candidate division Zixibacteria bacterium 4484_95]|nr:MAG: hypothetical protein B6D58_02325 [candidate division Zixibacteria bacterium 4484_95]RKX21195.1 MAG: hypothetical protein DRP26_00125 [candidate division Zixibacteria bacterium]
MPELEIIKADKTQYRNWVTSEQLDFSGSIFYHPDFLEVAADILNLQFKPLICLSSGKLTGIVNLLIGNRFNVKTALIPRLFQYYGPVAIAGNTDVFEYVTKTIENEIDTAVFSIRPEESLKPDLCGWHLKNRLTYYLRPDTFENMKSDCFPDVKNKINKAVKVGIKVENISQFPYEIYQASFKRQRATPPLGKELLSVWVERLTNLNLAATFIAVFEGKPVSFRTQLVWGGYAYDWLAGAYPDYNHLGVNQLLILKIGEQFYRKSVKNWDLLGGDIKSIAGFKRSFGSIPKTHVQLEKNFSMKGRIYRLLMRLKAGLRRF